ncbi:39S ribosomal protein L15, mitochondrial [Collichthys lucidus]|uniref:Large ribosomal subunit protein uL15m n=1 Tax=Collichthys lucidus TaxID=240159 RepID=A0A4U5VH61_COLLU|nr:39S ribosomal protein L15, mitochondrial [Collichthys lucidus]
MSVPKKPGGKALEVLQNLPRITLANLRPEPGSKHKEKKRGRGQYGGNRSGRGHKGERQRGTRPRLGFEGGQTPFYLVIPKYGYNEGHSRRPQYQPLSLKRLQYLIDLGRVDPTQPIDLTQLVNARGVTVQPLKRDYGVQLVDEVTSAYFVDRVTLSHLAYITRELGRGSFISSHSSRCFVSLIQSCGVLFGPSRSSCAGSLIPKRMLPGEDMVPYYTDAENRGYLADPEKIRQARLALAQKYGYILPDISKDELYHMLSMRKDVRQIFFGLAPGWVVNMPEKKILKPTDEKLLKYYSS